VKSYEIAQYCTNRDVPNHTPGIISIQQGYNFLQLSGWRDSLFSEFFTSNGGHGLGIDPQKNKLVMDVDYGTLNSQHALATKLAIPVGAIELREQVRPTLNASSCYFPSDGNLPSGGPALGGCFRPVPGGVHQTTVIPGTSPPLKFGDSTITVPGIHQGFSETGWVTCSHCLNVALFGVNNGYQSHQNGVDSSSYWFNQIATESYDPPTFGCGIGNIYNCRYSDSAWMRRETNGDPQQGRIAQTLSSSGVSNCCVNGCAACAINSSSPRFIIYGTVAPVGGMQIEKVGITSGWTTGTISQPCHDEDDGHGHLLLCQGVSNLYNQVGDSGAPVFFWWSSYGVNTVGLVGLLWGGSGTGSTMYFSPWSGVAQDLGSIAIKYSPTWRQETSESANDVGVGANGHVWIISDIPYTGYGGGYYIKRRLSNGTWDGSNGGTAVRIAVDPSGNAWVVNGLQQIWRWTGSAWTQLPETARDIGVGANGAVWIISTTPWTGPEGGYYIKKWNGSSWTVIPGGASRISVDPSGNAWVVNALYQIWRYTGSAWSQVPGAGVDIGIAGDGMAWVLGTAASVYGGGNEIYWWSGFSWQFVPGGATSISAGRGGKPWVTNSWKQLHDSL
jgi:hypothetical protein